MKKPFFSIIIPVRKIGSFVHEAIPHYMAQTYKDFEIIIVSEADETVVFPKTKIVKVGRAPPSEKRNIGVSNSKGDILAFIDDDAYPAHNWLERAASDLENLKIIAVGGPSLVPHKATFFQKVSNKVYELSSRKTGIRYGNHKKIEEIDDWPTCNLFVRRKDFLKTTGFNTKYWGGEDTQLCYELIKTGKKMIYDPFLKVYHHPRKKLGQHIRQTFFWGLWRGFFMRKYSNSRRLTFLIPASFVIWLFFGAIFSAFSNRFLYVYMFSMVAYVMYLLTLGIRSKSMRLFFPVIFVTMLTHIAYGLGFIKGISSNKEPIKKTLNPSENKKIT